MSREYPQNKVVLEPDNGAHEIVRGAFYKSTDGMVYHGVAPNTNELRLVSLADGNRWADDDYLDLNEFTRIAPGQVITITVGDNQHV